MRENSTKLQLLMLLASVYMSRRVNSSQERAERLRFQCCQARHDSSSRAAMVLIGIPADCSDIFYSTARHAAGLAFAKK